MARTLLCEIVTPERIVYNNEVQMVVVMTTTGEIGILPLHAPLVSTIAPGEVRLKTGDGAADWETFSVSGGYVQVHEDKVLVLADAALSLGQIDADRARESKDAIERRLAELPPEAEDEREQCVRDLNWCDIQIKAAEKAK
jgi:F-type H+-transporting ATPase subunit epsilon